MSKSTCRRQATAGRLTALTMALSATMGGMTPTAANAQTTINSNVGAQTWASGDFSITNTGTISNSLTALTATGTLPGTLTNSGGAINGGNTGISSAAGNTITVLNNMIGGTINGSINAGIFNSGSIGSLTNSSIINGGNSGIVNAPGSAIAVVNNTIGGTISGRTGINNHGSIGSLTNSGAIGRGTTGIFNDTGRTITVLNNTIGGTISGSTAAVYNSGSIGSLINSGAVSGGNIGITNTTGSTITVLNNTIGGAISGNTGINSGGSIGSLTNSGTISGANSGISLVTGSTMTALNNMISGVISGVNGVNNSGSIGALTNSGTISGNFGIANFGTIGALSNSGLISGGIIAISILSTGNLGPMTNSGIIAGAISNASIRDLTINGGTGSSFGTLTGFSGGSTAIGADNIGTITNTASNVVFASGNQLLNDNINVGSHTVMNNAGGTLQVNNRIAITGNYSQGAAAVLNIGVTTGSIGTAISYGRLVVSGSATIAAGSSVNLGSAVFFQGQRFVVVQAATAGTNYNAGSLIYTGQNFNDTVIGLSVTDSDNSSGTDLVITMGTLSPQVAFTYAALPSLSGLFNYAGTNPGLLNLFDASIAAAAASPAAANHVAAQLSPAATGAAASHASFAPTAQVLDVVLTHVDGLRLAQVRGNSGVAAGERAGDVAMWGQAFGGASNQGERDNVSGYHATYGGLLLGADTPINDDWRAGGLLSYASTSAINNGDNTGSSAHINAYGLIGYASYASDPWYLDLTAGAVQQRYHTVRSVDSIGDGADGSFNGRQYIVSAVAGYPLKPAALPDFTLTPIAGVTYSTLRQDGYTETGSSAALSVGAASTTSLKSDLGAKLEHSFATGYGQLAAAAKLLWRHEYHDTALQSVSNFAADTSGATTFTVRGPRPLNDTAVLALGLTLTRSRNMTLSAHYVVETGSAYTAQTADVRLRYQF